MVTVEALGTDDPPGGSVRVTAPWATVADGSYAVLVLSPSDPRAAPAEPGSWLVRAGICTWALPVDSTSWTCDPCVTGVLAGGLVPMTLPEATVSEACWVVVTWNPACC